MKRNQQTEGGAKIRKKSWLYGGLSAAVVVLAAAIVFIVLAVNGVFTDNNPSLDNGGQTSDSASGDSSGDGSGGADGSDGSDSGAGSTQTPDDVNTGKTESFVNPLDAMTVLNEQGFFYNSTLDCYYEHVGIDISAAAGSDVYAICSGTIEGIYTGDILQGTQIVLTNEDGVKVVYSYVEPVETLQAGDTVQTGQVIAEIAEPTGSEYKSGAHLHLEMYVGDVLADPAAYLTLDEK